MLSVQFWFFLLFVPCFPSHSLFICLFDWLCCLQYVCNNFSFSFLLPLFLPPDSQPDTQTSPLQLPQLKLSTLVQASYIKYGQQRERERDAGMKHAKSAGWEYTSQLWLRHRAKNCQGTPLSCLQNQFSDTSHLIRPDADHWYHWWRTAELLQWKCGLETTDTHISWACTQLFAQLIWI